MPTPRVGTPVDRSIADTRVLDASGASVAVGTFWANGPCLVVLLRHFGCVGCAEQMTELAPRLGDLAHAGVRTVLVGNGSREQLADFIERHALRGAPVEVVTDPPLALYAALELRRSTWATIGPRALVEIARAMTAGHPHRPTEGDRTQQGGVLLVDGRGIVRFFHSNRSLGDHADTSDLVEAALRLRIEASVSAAVRV
ncbi:MAG TPA: peroxiredoxin-like family protein [Polyangiaceae bacterium]